jgi:hypothetical protein
MSSSVTIGDEDHGGVAVAVWMTKSILVTCCTGRSAGLSPLRTRAGVNTSLAPRLRKVATVAHKAAGHVDYFLFRFSSS